MWALVDAKGKVIRSHSCGAVYPQDNDNGRINIYPLCVFNTRHEARLYRLTIAYPIHIKVVNTKQKGGV